MGVHPKLRVEMPEPQSVSFREHLWDTPYQGQKNCCTAKVGKVAEAEDPIVPARVNVIRGSKWKAKQPVEWDELIKWKLPAAASSPLMEQLGEKFGGLEIKVVASLGAGALVAGTGSAVTHHPVSSPPAGGSDSTSWDNWLPSEGAAAVDFIPPPLAWQ